jgi:hypothetical protein
MIQKQELLLGNSRKEVDVLEISTFGDVSLMLFP